MAGTLQDVSRDMNAPIREGEFTDDVNPQAAERLFKEIVLQTVEDACLTIPDAPPITAPKDWEPSHLSTETNSQKAWRKSAKAKRDRIQRMIRVRDEARDALLNMRNGFHIVCSLAGFDPDYIRSKAEKLAAKDWRNPMEKAA